MEQKFLDKLEELKNTNAFPNDDVNNLLPIDECTFCGKKLNSVDGYGVPDGILCDKCFKKSKFNKKI